MSFHAKPPAHRPGTCRGQVLLTAGVVSLSPAVLVDTTPRHCPSGCFSAVGRSTRPGDSTSKASVNKAFHACKSVSPARETPPSQPVSLQSSFKCCSRPLEGGRRGSGASVTVLGNRACQTSFTYSCIPCKTFKQGRECLSWTAILRRRRLERFCCTHAHVSPLLFRRIDEISCTLGTLGFIPLTA